MPLRISTKTIEYLVTPTMIHKTTKHRGKSSENSKNKRLKICQYIIHDVTISVSNPRKNDQIFFQNFL